MSPQMWPPSPLLCMCHHKFRWIIQVVWGVICAEGSGSHLRLFCSKIGWWREVKNSVLAFSVSKHLHWSSTYLLSLRGKLTIILGITTMICRQRFAAYRGKKYKSTQGHCLQLWIKWTISFAVYQNFSLQHNSTLFYFYWTNSTFQTCLSSA